MKWRKWTPEAEAKTDHYLRVVALVGIVAWVVVSVAGEPW